MTVDGAWCPICQADHHTPAIQSDLDSHRDELRAYRRSQVLPAVTLIVFALCTGTVVVLLWTWLR